ncbi:MAG TPA: TetR/AcrR family transcriptional regulator [Syntrophorhabdaceae bacterium]|nr:TetR/AcrR family transcriptional regulator [Syntrophorhabdaceae bacterium]
METKKISRREREKLSHRSQILGDALLLFTEKGYHNVSMHEIAAKAEFSIGTLYKYFKNKEDLYSALIIDKAEGFFQVIDEVFSRKDSVENIIREYVAVKTGIIKDNLTIIRLLFTETRGIRFNDDTGFCKVLREIHQKEMKKVASLIAKGMRARTFRKLDPHRLAVSLLGLMDGFMFNWLEDPDTHPYATNVSFIVELFFEGCLARAK